MAEAKLRVLIVDDEKNIRDTLALCVETMGHEATTVASIDEALRASHRSPYDVAFVDLRLSSESGLDLLPRLLTGSPNLEVIVITAYASYESAVEAVKRGAHDYLPKPFTPADVRQRLQRLTARRSLEQRVIELEGLLADSVPEAELATQSPAMQSAIDVVRQAAKSNASVLLCGESGTGKGVLARLLHSSSARAAHPFVVVSCPTLTEDLLASELFGHARGAFTGALQDRAGRVEAAHGGTLFLDEVSEIPSGLQAKLLRFLQDRQFERLGETRTREADVRIVAATHRDLEQEVAAGRFRLDLLYRLNVVEVLVPPLRERRSDIVHLARHFLAFFTRASGRAPLELSEAAERALLAHSWPGNVRELRNEMERAVVLVRGRVLEPASLSERVSVNVRVVPEIGGNFTVEEIEREHIESVSLRAATREEAAKILGIDASTIWRKRKKYESQ